MSAVAELIALTEAERRALVEQDFERLDTTVARKEVVAGRLTLEDADREELEALRRATEHNRAVATLLAQQLGARLNPRESGPAYNRRARLTTASEAVARALRTTG